MVPLEMFLKHCSNQNNKKKNKDTKRGEILQELLS